MQPQATDPQPPPSPAPQVESGQNSTGPAGQFDFMMKDQPRPRGRFGLLLSGIPKPVKIITAVLIGLMLLIISYSLIFGGRITNTDQLTSVMASAQEITRVSALAQQQAGGADTKDLAATTAAVLSSQVQELQSYLETNGVKVDTKKLTAQLDKNIDAKLASALQNNNYDQTYFSYLKTNLAAYQNDLTTAREGAGKNAQTILDAAYTSIQTLLTAPQFK